MVIRSGRRALRLREPQAARSFELLGFRQVVAAPRARSCNVWFIIMGQGLPGVARLVWYQRARAAQVSGEGAAVMRRSRCDDARSGHAEGCDLRIAWGYTECEYFKRSKGNGIERYKAVTCGCVGRTHLG